MQAGGDGGQAAEGNRTPLYHQPPVASELQEVELEEVEPVMQVRVWQPRYRSAVLMSVAAACPCLTSSVCLDSSVHLPARCHNRAGCMLNHRLGLPAAESESPRKGAWHRSSQAAAGCEFAVNAPAAASRGSSLFPHNIGAARWALLRGGQSMLLGLCCWSGALYFTQSSLSSYPKSY
jgi:hypothetical protein